jgi:hypothetical protein
MVRWCSEPGCDKQAMFRDGRGKLKADDDHDLCQQHYRAKANAERAQRIAQENYREIDDQ